jgi:hypothetical protein
MTKFKQAILGLGILASLVQTAIAQASYAAEPSSDGQVRFDRPERPKLNCPGGQGGGSALPFGPNQTAELADGELYQLKGWVRVRANGTVDLEVDLCAHPWLATAIRRAKPFYLLGQPVSGNWTPWTNRKIELAVRAHVEILVGSDYRGRLVIWLESLQMPVNIKN